jgi:hypothetical protein
LSTTPAAISPERRERRSLVLLLLSLIILSVAAYMIFFMGGTGAANENVADSTAFAAGLEAQRLLDSSQMMLNAPEITPMDTGMKAAAQTQPELARPKTFAREDSLVLEAFTSAPVWFSLRMDSARTERGSLGSNEHIVWRARSQFVVTLGDAGAVTFFLNGREIGTLGEEGSVVKNIVISRQQLGGN